MNPISFLLDILEKAIFVFFGFTFGFILGIGAFSTGLLTIISSHWIITYLVLTILLVGIFFMWGLLKKDKIEQRRDLE